jgi:hypothetical protein
MRDLRTREVDVMENASPNIRVTAEAVQDLCPQHDVSTAHKSARETFQESPFAPVWDASWLERPADQNPMS